MCDSERPAGSEVGIDARRVEDVLAERGVERAAAERECFQPRGRLGVAVRVAAVYFILISGLLVGLLVLGQWRWIAIAPTLGGLALLTTAGGLVLTLLLFATVGPRATRVISQVMGALIGASLILVFQAPNYIPGADRTAAMRRLVNTVRTLDLPSDSPWLVPARALLGDVDALAAWLIASVLAFALAVAWFSLRYAKDAAAAVAAAPKRRKSERVRGFRGGVTASLLRKEWRLLRRDPVLLSQILLQLIYLVPMLFYLVRDLGDSAASAAFLGVVGGAVSVIGASLAASLVWITVSAEDAPDLVAAAPLSRARIERAKLLGAVTPVLLVIAGASALLAAKSPTAALWTFVGGVCAAISAGLVGLWHQEPGSRRDFRRRPRASWTAQLGQGFVGLGWASATGICASGLPPLLALIPALIALGLLLALHESRRNPAAA